MKKLIILCQVALLALFSIPLEKASAAPLVDIGIAPATVAKYEKFEVPFTISGIGTAGTDFNPYNPNLSDPWGNGAPWNKKGVYVDAIITKPSGGTLRWPAFWNGTRWILRFAPTETGTWKYKIYAKYDLGEVTSVEKTFEAVASSNKGYLQVNPNNKLTFRFQNGDPFYPIGSATTSPDQYSMSDVFKSIGDNNGNYARIFQETGTALEYPTRAIVNDFGMDKATNMDSFIEYARANGVYVDFTLDSWTRMRPTDQNPYILSGMVGSVGEFFSDAEAREVYKRKLRYILARWGYSTNLMSIEFINETGGGTDTLGGYPQSKPWLTEMSAFVKGDTSKIPSSWGNGAARTNFNEQGPHLTTCSNGTDFLTTKYIPWNEGSMDYVNMHNYIRDYMTWNNVQGDNLEMEPLGSELDKPWKDTAVIADRVARMANKRYKWDKPISITEYGLAIETIKDWETGYEKDLTARHVHDAMWAGFFSGVSFNHWKSSYMMGRFGGGNKMTIFKAMSNFFNGITLDNMTTETAYPVADPLNTSPKLVSSNNKIMAVAWLDSTKAYFYTKNLTTVWGQVLGVDGCETSTATPEACGPMPTPANQTGTVQIKNLTPGAYTLAKFSTVETDPLKQVLETFDVTVGTDGIATASVSLGTTEGMMDYAYKLTRKVDAGSIKVTSDTDKATLAVNDSFTITDKISNTTASLASNLSLVNILPYGTEYISSSDNGDLGTKDIPCDQVSVYKWPACPAGESSFRVKTVTWSGISVAPGTDKTVTLNLKYVGPLTPPSPANSVSMTVGGDPSAGQPYSLEATTNVLGDIRVEFWVDGSLRITENNAPYSLFGDSSGVLTKGTLGGGTHTVVAKVFDQNGITLLSTNTITITEGNAPPPLDTQAPVVSITAPSNGASIRLKTAVTITANATDDKAVTKVEFYINGALKASDTLAPYSMSWNTAGSGRGSENIMVKAYDAAGNVSQAEITVNLTRR